MHFSVNQPLYVYLTEQKLTLNSLIFIHNSPASNCPKVCDNEDKIHHSQQLAFPQIALFSFGHDLVISPRLSPPAACSPALPAAGPSLFLQIGWLCCSNFFIRCYMKVELSSHWTESGTCAWTFLLLKYVVVVFFFVEYCKCCLCFKLFTDMCAS